MVLLLLLLLLLLFNISCFFFFFFFFFLSRRVVIQSASETFRECSEIASGCFLNAFIKIFRMINQKRSLPG